MNQPLQDERIATSLRIEVQLSSADAWPVQFTMLDSNGEALPAAVTLRDGELENLHDVLAKIAAHAAPAAGGLPFGGPDETRVILGFDDYVTPHFNFYCTFAYPSAEGGYHPVTGRALVTDASLARLVDGLREVKDAGQGVVDWVIAD
ncbi:hypothetical protein [Pseudoduganella albidiflava]|uniref:DUF3830 family protein n=1 Tax=Pseudoduganella albidiflava TaxID=321983 RepID=A0A411WU38_9BURK|nr:hypothetical protein [Pseudoduganella albidiflava]QBI00280.1 hypothetical protein EYF70_04995 [Pseudoduganella albidiflava]GGY52621.1 hypothetical protein GCM10007387_38670 [Pseudoduganella albidiflava]